jgi:hypothetical protein
MSCHIDWFGGEILKCPYDDIQVQLKVNMVKWVYVDLQISLKIKFGQMSIWQPTDTHQKSQSGQMSIRWPTSTLKQGNLDKWIYDGLQVSIKKSISLSSWFCFLFISSISLLYSVYVMDHVYVLLCNLVYFFTNTICKCIDYI